MGYSNSGCRLIENCPLKRGNFSWGNASNWHNAAPSADVKTPSNYTPVFGDLALWDSAAGGLGHVAFVSSVSNGIASLYEYNSGYPLDANGHAQWGLFYSGETTASSSRGTPSEYIHLPGVNVTSTSWPGVGSASFFGSSQMNPGQRLNNNSYLLSSNVMLALVMQTDGNLVLYSGNSILWASGTGGNPGAYLNVQSDGNIVIYTSSNVALWSTGTAGQSLGRLNMQDDGNLVAYSTSNVALWATGTGGRPTLSYFGSDRLAPNQSLSNSQYLRSSDSRYAMLLQSDGNLVLYGPGYHALWSTGTPNQGVITALMQSDGNLVLYKSNGAVWSTGTSGRGSTTAIMQSDGNFVLYAPGGASWSSGTGGRI